MDVDETTLAWTPSAKNDISVCRLWRHALRWICSPKTNKRKDDKISVSKHFLQTYHQNVYNNRCTCQLMHISPQKQWPRYPWAALRWKQIQSRHFPGQTWPHYSTAQVNHVTETCPSPVGPFWRQLYIRYTHTQFCPRAECNCSMLRLNTRHGEMNYQGYAEHVDCFLFLMMYVCTYSTLLC